MVQASTLKDEVSKPQTFGELTIERRVLLMKNETISIPSIASIVVREWTETRKPPVILVLLGAGFVGWLVALALGHRTYGGGIEPNSTAWFLVSLIAFGIIYVLATSSTDFRRLVIFTNDGRATYFNAPDVAVLEKVRRVLSDKINAHDEATIYNINLEKGTIENISVGRVDAIGALVTGDSNQVAVGQGRIGTTEVAHSTGVQVGQGNVWQGDAMSKVDYARFIPTVNEWTSYYAGLGHHDLAAELEKLEQLMRAGTPSPAEKKTLRDLVTDLGKIIGGTGEVAHFFSMIARAAGF